MLWFVYVKYVKDRPSADAGQVFAMVAGCSENTRIAQNCSKNKHGRENRLDSCTWPQAV